RNLALLEDMIGESLPNGETVCNPLNVSVHKTLTWPSEANGRNLACVARLEPGAKGQDLLLHIFARPEWRSRPIKLNFYGMGVGERGLQRMAKRLQVENICFHGHVTDVTEVWRQNHMLVLPSRYEGTPLALLEAMRCSRPAMVTDVSG